MSLSKIKTLALALTITAAANAQFSTPTNARTFTLGGAPLADIADIYAYPVLLTGYLNQVQATWNGGGGTTGLGPVFITKSFGDIIGLGIVANNYSLLNDVWSDIAGDISGFNPNALPNVPHVLLGFDFGAFKLGADLFFELASTNNTTTTTPQKNGPDGDVENNDSSVTTSNYTRVMNLGTRLSAAIDFGSLGLLVKAGFGFPSFTNERSQEGYVETPDGVLVGPYDANNYSQGTERGLYVELGAEVSFPVSSVDLTGGLEYTFADFKLDRRVYDNSELNTDYDWSLAANTQLGTNDYWNSLLRFYVNAEVNILETAAAVVSYEFRRTALTETQTIKEHSEWRTNTADRPADRKPDSTVAPEWNQKNTDGWVYHSFFVGAENVWDNAWIFDSFALRSGLSYTIGWSFENRSNDYYDDTYHRGNPADHDYNISTYGKPVIGVGVSKGALTLDAALNFGRLFENYSETSHNENRGPLFAPTFAMATATIKF
jgi:hypothetical protein